jgi:ribosomal protein S18 acetylase RimI-like enzyme
VPTPAADGPHRVPFTPADAEATIAFCAAHGPFDAALLRRLLLDLTSDPAGVFVIRDGASTALVATVVDRATNGVDAANLETLGVRAPLTADAFARLVVEPAIAFTRAGERSALSVGLQASVMPASSAEGALRRAGFTHAYDGYEMRRPRHAPPLEPIELLPDGWTWAPLNELRADDAHAALAEMFRGAPSFNSPPRAEFRAAVASGATNWRVLLDGQRIAGLLQIAFRDAPDERRRGEVRIVGRAPAYRGRGLGPRLLREGLRLLELGGAGDVDLVVEAENVRALALYRRFGFEPIAQTPVFMLKVR